MALKNVFFPAAAGLLLLLSAAAQFSSAQQPDIVLTGVNQISDRQVEAYFTLINPTNSPEATLSVATSDNIALDTSTRQWDCFKAQDEPKNTCSTRLQVIGAERVTAGFTLKKFFPSDFIYVTFQLPASNTSVITKFLISHTADPNRITASTLFYSALLLMLVGLVAWVVAFESGRLKCLPGPLGRAFDALNESILFGAVLANLLVALGVVIIFSPYYSPFTVALFAITFAAGVLFLFHARQASGRADYVCPPDISREKARLEEMIRIARGKYMRNELDEKTFRDIVDKIEMEVIRMEAGERKRWV